MSVEDTAASPAADDLKPVDGEITATVTDVKPDTADSSAADAGAKQPESMFDALKRTLNRDSGEAPPTSETKTEDPDPTKAEDADEEDEDKPDNGELSEDEKKVLSQKTQRRIQNFSRKVKELEPLADRTRKLDAYLQTNGIPPQDAIDALGVVALMRSNPEQAYNQLSSLLYDMSLQLGKTLPSDIREKVEKGTIDEATGRELALARVRNQGLERATETLSVETQEQHAQQVKGAITNAVTAWESTVRTRDPDFEAKKPQVVANFRALIQAGEKLETPDDSVRLMKKAYQQVNEFLKSAVPQRRHEVKPPPASLGNPAPKARPSTHEDAVRQALVA